MQTVVVGKGSARSGIGQHYGFLPSVDAPGRVVVVAALAAGPVTTPGDGAVATVLEGALLIRIYCPPDGGCAAGCHRPGSPVHDSVVAVGPTRRVVTAVVYLGGPGTHVVWLVGWLGS